MRALVQRVSSASVTVGGERVASVGHGMLVLLGVRAGDGEREADHIVRKLLALRIFEDEDDRMTLSAGAVTGETLGVTHSPLSGDARKGTRPSFTPAAPPAEAEPLYERVRESLGAQGGRFG